MSESKQTPGELAPDNALLLHATFDRPAAKQRVCRLCMDALDLKPSRKSKRRDVITSRMVKEATRRFEAAGGVVLKEPVFIEAEPAARQVKLMWRQHR